MNPEIDFVNELIARSAGPVSTLPALPPIFDAGFEDLPPPVDALETPDDVEFVFDEFAPEVFDAEEVFDAGFDALPPPVDAFEIPDELEVELVFDVLALEVFVDGFDALPPPVDGLPVDALPVEDEEPFEDDELDLLFAFSALVIPISIYLSRRLALDDMSQLLDLLPE